MMLRCIFFSFGCRLRSFGKGYHSASDRVRTLCGFCKLLQRNAALVTFVGVNHQSFTFCYLFFLQSADLEFCSAEGGLSM
ncbi:hypothetical protein L3X38_042966 [Prunus dulcis]|uniref:Uncharacterized protein n=1 Tax=Prunus dulcis TaxID=3755 RepID=A0AAD4UVV1_PRUDU|nr:hypothetical protein L3X38_042966 [Prunus dulcis]